MDDSDTTDFPARLSTWCDSDGAAYELAVALGALPPHSFTEHKWIFWTVNPLGDGLRQALFALVSAGLLDYDEAEDRFRHTGATPEPDIEPGPNRIAGDTGRH